MKNIEQFIFLLLILTKMMYSILFNYLFFFFCGLTIFYKLLKKTKLLLKIKIVKVKNPLKTHNINYFVLLTCSTNYVVII